MNNYTPFIALLAFLFFCASAQADERRLWEEHFYELVELDDNAMTEDDYDRLCDLNEHRININTATREELEQLPFLSAQQVEDICEYIYRHGAMRTLSELLLIKSLDRTCQQFMTNFTYAGESPKQSPPSLSELFKSGHSTLTLSVSQPLYQRKGDRNGYLGYNTKHSFRYTFSSHEQLCFGLLGSQDSGEPFFSSKNSWGYDHYAFFVQLKNRGIFDNLVVGHYRVQFGLGLVANTGFYLGKTAFLTTLGRAPTGISPSLSKQSSSYLQGVAATTHLTKNTSASIFLSYRPIDATLNDDNSTIKTIVTTGYHRTPTEIEKKNNAHNATAGLNLHYAKNGFYTGLTAVFTHFDRNLKPQTSTDYRRYYPTGNNFLNVGAEYGYRDHYCTLLGETAIDRGGAIATLNSISANLSDALSVVVVQRYYSYKYTSLYANSFSDGGDVKNETGCFLGVTYRPLYTLTLKAYADYAHFSWARYRVSRPSNSFDYLLSANATVKQATLFLRYRARIRYRNNEKNKAIIRHTAHSLRMKADYPLLPFLSTSTQADFTLVNYKGRSHGYMVSQSVNTEWKWLKATLSANLFHTDDYESRIYAYERGPLHSFAFPSYYGYGLRYALFVRADISDELMTIVKIGVTDYFDRAVISSSLQQINASSKADVEVQLRYKF